MCSFCTAFLRKEGVKVRGFPLTAAPVFHPGYKGQTSTLVGFSAATYIRKCNATLHYSLAIFIKYLLNYFNKYNLHITVRTLIIVLTLHGKLGLQSGIGTHQSHSQVPRMSEVNKKGFC